MKLSPLPFALATCLLLALPRSDAAPYKLIHAFKGGANDGRTPTYQSSLTPSPAGDILYGMTLDGGKYSNGVVFSINTTGTGLQIIHTFDGVSVLNPAGSQNDGAYPLGTPVLSGNTLYGMTEEGGSNGYVGGTIFSVNTDHTGFQVLHHFGGANDGWAPQGSLILSGSTLYGMTEEGGNNADSGILFSIQTNGANYTILHGFDVPGQGSPQGTLLQWGTTLYGMTHGTIFRMESDGTGFLVVHQFTGTTTDGSAAYGSLVRQGAYLYGMTYGGGQYGLGTVFQLNLIGSVFQLIHSFSFNEAYSPYGDLALSGSTLYGMTHSGVTNYHGSSLGSGSVFQVNTNGTGYQIMHTFMYPITANDGSVPFGTPLILNGNLYGMTSLGGSSGALNSGADGGCIFALTLPAGSGTTPGNPPTISTASALPNGLTGAAYHEQLAATGGLAPYTWTLSAGHLPPGITLSAAGLLSGKPTKGDVATFTVKVTAHDKEAATQNFTLTIEAPPTLTITTPKAAQKVTTPTLTVTGTTSEGDGVVADVYAQLNGGAWLLAQSANGNSNWNIPNLPLPADSDVLNVYAVDTFGNHSKTNTVKFTYYVTGPLTVTTNGHGTITPNDNGKSLQIGATFSLTAKPVKGFIFQNWTDGTGTVLTQAVTLKFVMASNLVLTANFAAAPATHIVPEVAPVVSASGKFGLATGTYAGLFAPPNGAKQVTNSGAIRLNVTKSGAFSGKIIMGADSVPFVGSFDEAGTASILISGEAGRVTSGEAKDVTARHQVTFTAEFQLDAGRQSVSGQLTDGSFRADVLALRSPFNAGAPATNYQGAHSVLVKTGISGSAAQSIIGTATVDRLGNVIFTLPGRKPITQSSAISAEGYWPLCLSEPDGTLVWGWNQIIGGSARSEAAIIGSQR